MKLAVKTENPRHSMSLAKTHLTSLRSLVNSLSFQPLLDCLSSDVICGRLIRPFKKFDGAGPLPQPYAVDVAISLGSFPDPYLFLETK